MASLNQSGRPYELRLQAWLCTFYLAPWEGCSDPCLSDPESLRDHSRITPAQFPERSGHASPCSGYAPGGSGSQKRREVGPKTERASVKISAENIYNSTYTTLLSVHQTPIFCREISSAFSHSSDILCILQSAITRKPYIKELSPGNQLSMDFDNSVSNSPPYPNRIKPEGEECWACGRTPAHECRMIRKDEAQVSSIPYPLLYSILI